jgi:competence protein ComEC
LTLVGALTAVIVWRRVGKSALMWMVLAVTVAVVGSGLVSGLRVWQLSSAPVAALAEQGRVIDAELTIESVSVAGQWGTVRVTANLERLSWQGGWHKVGLPVVLAAGGEQLESWRGCPIGSRVAVSVRLAPASRTDGVVAQVKALDPPTQIAPPAPWIGVIESMRQGLTTAVGHNPVEQRALLPALVVGETGAVSDSMADDFQATGLTHLTAVSGANLAILLTCLGGLARLVGVRSWGLTLVSAIAVLFFVALCHSEASVLRAAAMGLVSLVAVGRGSGKRSGLRGLALAVIALCWIDPWLARSWGMALSVLACSGIICWGARWAGVLGQWLPRWLAEVMAIPLAAQIATQPIICHLSGSISVAGLMANASAGPWVAPATILGLVAALISPWLPQVAMPIAFLGGWCAQPILWLSHGLARLPGVTHAWPAAPVGVILIVALCLLLAGVMAWLLARPLLVIGASVILTASMLSAPYQPGWPAADWQLVACDVGQADGLAIRLDQRSALIIDTGSADKPISPCLRQLGVERVALLLLSHYHADHAGGLADLLSSLPVDQVIGPVGGGDDSGVIQLLASHDVPWQAASGGEQLQYGLTRLSIVSAYQGGLTGDSGEESAAENDQSLIARVDTPTWSLLATGDVEILGQQAALEHPDWLAVDVVKVPHHGSARQDSGFLAATKASIALISVGADNGYGHPVPRIVKELIGDGMEVIRTDQHGSIALAKGDSWTITSQR